MLKFVLPESIHCYNVKLYTRTESMGDENFIKRVYLITVNDIAAISMICIESTLNSYLEYIDTTGLCDPREIQSCITKELVRQYVIFSKEVLLIKSIHVFCSAKKELIFTNSYKNLQKKPLEPHELINWWIRTLDPVTESGFIYSPFHEKYESNYGLKRLIQSTKWHYNYFEEKKAHFSIITHFPGSDDPKWMHLKCMKESGRDQKLFTVEQFWETIHLRNELKQCSAFLVLDFNKNLTNSSIDNRKFTEITKVPIIENLIKSFDWYLNPRASTFEVIKHMNEMDVEKSDGKMTHKENIKNFHSNDRKNSNTIEALMKESTIAHGNHNILIGRKKYAKV